MRYLQKLAAGSLIVIVSSKSDLLIKRASSTLSMGESGSVSSPKRQCRPARFQEIFDAMKTYRDDQGDFISQPFNRLPPKRQNQDYYNVVKIPIDLTMIQKKIRNEEYNSIDDFQKDVEQIMNNAKSYYDSADKEYVDGCALYAVFKKTLAKVMTTPSTDEESDQDEEMSESNASSDSDEKPTMKRQTRTPAKGGSVRGGSIGGRGRPPRGRPSSGRPSPAVTTQPVMDIKGSTNEDDYVIADLDDPFAVLFDNIVLMSDADGDPICGPFLTLPSKRDYPDYYDDIEKPIALDKIRSKVIKSKYKSLEQMEEDIILMCNNAREYNVEGSQIYNDATAIMRFTRKKRVEVRVSILFRL